MFSKFDKIKNTEANIEASALLILWKAIRNKSHRSIKFWQKNCSILIKSIENKQLVEMLLGKSTQEIDEKVKSRYNALMARIQEPKR